MRPGVLGWLPFVDVTRVHRTMPGVVSWSSSGPSGPSRATASMASR